MRIVCIFGVAAGLLLCGCASERGAWQVDDFSRYHQAVPGQSTRLEVYQLFGQPHLVERSEGRSTWRYFRTVSRQTASSYIPVVGVLTAGHDVDSSQAEFRFDDSGVLLAVERTEGARYRNIWLAVGEGADAELQLELLREEMVTIGAQFDLGAARQGLFTAGIAGH